MRQCIGKPGRISLLILVTALTLPVFTPAREQSGEADGELVLEQPDQGAQTARQFETLLLLKPLADKGDPEAQFLLGGLYSRGEGVPRDDAKAASWWRKSAEQGLAYAQNELGAALADGRGVPKDPKQAAVWYRKAAEQGLAVAQANLGTMYWTGSGVSLNLTQAVEWYRQAAEQGLGWAQFYLGDAYLAGKGIVANQKLAVEWYTKAAEQGYTDAQYALGTLYPLGTLYRRDSAVPSDLSRATYWLARAAQSGHEKAEQDLQFILRGLPKIQLPTAIEVRAQPDARAPIIKARGERKDAYELNHPQDWVAVYLEDEHTVGYVRAEQLRGK